MPGISSSRAASVLLMGTRCPDEQRQGQQWVPLGRAWAWQDVVESPSLVWSVGDLARPQTGPLQGCVPYPAEWEGFTSWEAPGTSVQGGQALPLGPLERPQWVNPQPGLSRYTNCSPMGRAPPRFCPPLGDVLSLPSPLSSSLLFLPPSSPSLSRLPSLPSLPRFSLLTPPGRRSLGGRSPGVQSSLAPRTSPSRLPRAQRPWQRQARVPGWAVGTILGPSSRPPGLPWSPCSECPPPPWSNCCALSCAPRPCAPWGALAGAASARGTPTTLTLGLCLSRSTAGLRCGDWRGGEGGDGVERGEGADRGDGARGRGRGAGGAGTDGLSCVRPGATDPGQPVALNRTPAGHRVRACSAGSPAGFHPLQD